MSQSNHTINRPRLAITLGDPAGIGPEVVLKALSDSQFWEFDITVVGTRSLLVDTYTKLKSIDGIGKLVEPSELKILDVEIGAATIANIIPGEGSAASGRASFAFLEQAIARATTGEFDAIVTAPIAKSAWKAAGYNYPGQTELLQEKSGAKRVGMLFVARSPHTGWILRTLLATTHIPLCQVAKVLTPELMTQKLDLLVECLKNDFGIEYPRIAVSGLNPHSGEQGQLGTEEQDWLVHWIEEQNSTKLRLDGPIPPDTMWVKPGMAWYGNSQNSNPADAYLALYHDQGLIPVKLMAFDRAVNTSIGLPFVRTSPDHGTAFDIALKGIADATSMKAAIELAQSLSIQRKERKSIFV
ncbi:4-hydroxythreonine-4-phosphate dehydrogenase [Dulcicalothrix desertica PCC 7102]|uniref:4-hydroxythreonine-4-phosphate dehydrogenase n=1 Tax=Dulcicalothrix desertica PCC 7102 TaxID=232991 RepID=A0A433VNH8_9CYAN|nr:4-hydroxythreonine-4-phosphate dehydrogenase PdxA [Dulcicalothrix desertica]RUT07611.1 4-hydroxythreonine-4-phosphate dehydrogenase [Dulcicalothrix desertica PCC 7102]TWH39780.1 4-hydroxythreonine-4-phosphate dehydrogenase [Dulcicalothrix desertica PCC 7102]